MNKESIINKLKKDGIVVTHFGDDLDNTACIEALRRESGVDLEVERVPAGQFITGRVNIDTGGHRGSWERGNTIVIDGDPAKGIRSAIMQLKILGFKVPEPIVELADVMIIDSRLLEPAYGLILAKYLAPSKLFSFAEKGLLQKKLTESELQEYGLEEGYQIQKKIITDTKNDIEYFRNGDTVIAEKYVPLGAAASYAMGCRYYASISPHRSGNGVTFAITSKPGIKLPDIVLDWGKKLSEEYRLDSNSSSVYVEPGGSMIIAGGQKNPEFSLPCTVDDIKEKIKALLLDEKEANV